MENVINIMRHEAVFNPKDHPYTVHIIGAGATGSHVFAALVNLGVTKINVYDYDDVEEHNLANQIYTGSDVGKPKVEGCREYVKHKLGLEEAPDDMRFVNDKVTTDTIASRDYCKGGIVFLLTDTMDSRRSIFRQLTRYHDQANADGAIMRNLAALIIETRMASTHGAVFTVNPFDSVQRKQWLHTLVDDSDEDTIELSPCGTALSVGPTANIIANYAVWQMLQFFTDPLGLQPQVDLFFKPTLTITSSAIAA